MFNAFSLRKIFTNIFGGESVTGGYIPPVTPPLGDEYQFEDSTFYQFEDGSVYEFDN